MAWDNGAATSCDEDTDILQQQKVINRTLLYSGHSYIQDTGYLYYLFYI